MCLCCKDKLHSDTLNASGVLALFVITLAVQYVLCVPLLYSYQKN